MLVVEVDAIVDIEALKMIEKLLKNWLSSLLGDLYNKPFYPYNAYVELFDGWHQCKFIGVQVV